MIRRLAPADYRAMPWANGRGTTLELLRAEAAGGGILWRLSIAAVVEDGPFSVLPGVARNLTVIEGPGFTLAGDLTLRCDPLRPVAFPGAARLRAEGVAGPCRDFNVMTADRLPPARVAVLRDGRAAPPAGGFVALYALEPAMVAGAPLARHHLAVARRAVAVAGGPVLAAGIAA